MKRKTLHIALVIVLAISSLWGCGNKDQTISSPATTDIEASSDDQTVSVVSEERDETSASEAKEPKSETDNLVKNADGSVNYLYYYSSVLSKVHSLMMCPSEYDIYADEDAWLYEISHYQSGREGLSAYGYCLRDISGDGIPELILTDRSGWRVFNVYTLADYEPKPVVYGYYRHNYFYMGDKRFGFHASAGGMYQTLASYELSENGQELIPIDYYFTCESSASRSIRECYHNTCGESDISKSELIENDNFNIFLEQYEEEQTSFDGVVIYADNTLEIAYSLDNPGKNVVNSYAADDSEYAQTIILYDENGMYDIELLGLEYIDCTDMGNLVFNVTYLYNLGQAKGDEAIAVTLTFGEIMPLYGIQYRDANGVIRKFAIDISGEDGSVLTWEF